MIGSIGHLHVSLYAAGEYTTGEGGMACEENPEWAERMRIMVFGISKDRQKLCGVPGTMKFSSLDTSTTCEQRRWHQTTQKM
jgi:dTDP-4-amino-4,6-dideoxygalactose transaminase